MLYDLYSINKTSDVSTSNFVGDFVVLLPILVLPLTPELASVLPPDPAPDDIVDPEPEPLAPLLLPLLEPSDPPTVPLLFMLLFTLLDDPDNDLYKSSSFLQDFSIDQ